MNRLFSVLQHLYLPSDPRCRLRGRAADDAEGVLGGPPLALDEALLERCLSGECAVGFEPAGSDGRLRAILLDFARPADWPAVAGLYQALQDELELPAPAVSVSARAGFRLWLALAEGVEPAVAADFLEMLRRRYLAELPVGSLTMWAGAEPAWPLLVPACPAPGGKWSAFIDPSMGAMFGAESGLEMAPNIDRQADLLSGLQAVSGGALRQAMARLRMPGAVPAVAVGPSSSAPAVGDAVPRADGRLAIGGGFTDPRSFLLAVMNDPSATAEQRIAAACALLPHVARGAEA